MIKKKLIFIAALTACLIAACVGATLALLIAVAGPVENTFTIGNVQLALAETTGESYQLIPGYTVKKDPKVTVLAGSDPCWLFVKITKSSDFDEYLTFETAQGWTHLGGYDGVYYRSVEKASIDLEYDVLKDNAIVVKDILTAEKMSNLTAPPTLSIRAFAVQSYSVETALDAWKLIAEVGE